MRVKMVEKIGAGSKEVRSKASDRVSEPSSRRPYEQPLVSGHALDQAVRGNTGSFTDGDPAGFHVG